MPKEKDISEKALESYTDVFADIVNGLLFGGREVIRETELEDAHPGSQLKLDGALHEQERDVAKFWKHDEIRIALCGMENQTEPDRDMALRILGYDGASYKEQVNLHVGAVPRLSGPDPGAVLRGYALDGAADAQGMLRADAGCACALCAGLPDPCV